MAKKKTEYDTTDAVLWALKMVFYLVFFWLFYPAAHYLVVTFLGPAFG